MDKIKAIFFNLYYWQRIVEMGMLYFVLPMLILFEMIPIPLLLVLVVMGFSLVLLLKHDPSFDKKIYSNWKIDKKQLIAKCNRTCALWHGIVC